MGKMNVDSISNVRSCNLMKANKDKLFAWVEHFVCLSEFYVDPLLSSACKVDEQAQTMKTEKISDQKASIELQEKLNE